MSRAFKLFKLFGPACLWLVFALLMCRDYYWVDPPDPTLQGTDAYGRNAQGSLATMLLWMAAELIVLYAILRPWSYQRSFWRALAALLLCVPWWLFSGVVTMHAGRVVALHFLWLTALTCVLLVCTVVSGVAAFRQRRRARAA